MIKKTAYLTALYVFLMLVLSQNVFAQCDSFGFPFYQGTNILFFSCDSGEIQKFDAQNKLSSIPRKESLGGFIHAFIWSPDGNRALVLAENVLATSQTLAFYSPERKMNSLNWWMYSLDTEKAVLLDGKIMSIGWASGDEVVYNWNNNNISLASINDPNFSKFTKLADITSDSNDLNTIISSVNLNNIIAFPMKNGFYAIDSNKKEAKYYSLAGGIEKIIPNPFNQNYFVAKSSNSLYKFSISDNSLTTVDSNFSATDFAFLDTNSLVVVGNDGKVYSYDIDLKSKNPVALNINGPVSNVFTTGNRGEFILSAGKNIFRKSTKSDLLVPLKQDPSNAVQPSTSNQSTQNSNGKNNWPMIVIIVLILVAILTVFFYLRAKKETTNT